MPDLKFPKMPGLQLPKLPKLGNMFDKAEEIKDRVGDLFLPGHKTAGEVKEGLKKYAPLIGIAAVAYFLMKKGK